MRTTGTARACAVFCVRADARLHWPAMPTPARHPYARICAPALLLAASLWAVHAAAATLADRARESGCTTKPVSISSALYKCVTRTGADAFFNVPDGHSDPAAATAPSARSAPTPSGFPRVDSD